jgi:hypothetical protein
MAQAQMYPSLSVSTWWKLRKAFNRTIPKEITAFYLTGILGGAEASVKVNVMPKLRLIGFIDENSKPTELARRWRNDDEYPAVCAELIEKFYSSELPESIINPWENKDRVITYFKNKTGLGESAARSMALFYIALSQADVSAQAEDTTTKNPTKTTSKPEKVKLTTRVASSEKINSPIEELVKETHTSSSFKPSVHIDVQIHISPESSPEQIDKIFESMAKHLSGMKK